jgi:hypothetical protein
VHGTCRGIPYSSQHTLHCSWQLAAANQADALRGKLLSAPSTARLPSETNKQPCTHSVCLSSRCRRSPRSVTGSAAPCLAPAAVCAPARLSRGRWSRCDACRSCCLCRCTCCRAACVTETASCKQQSSSSGSHRALAGVNRTAARLTPERKRALNRLACCSALASNMAVAVPAYLQHCYAQNMYT